jgi:tetratricopeptide (TPR) repeat protein
VRKLGNALLAARAGREAADRLDEAIRLAMASESKLEELHARGSLGLALGYLGKFDEANAQLRLVIDGSGGASARAHHLAMRNLGTVLRLQGRHAESLPWLEQAIAEASAQRSHRGDLAHGLLEAGLAELGLGAPDAAQRYFVRAAALFDDVQKARMTPARADLLVGMARVRMERMDHAAALPLLESADDFWRSFDPENRWAGETALWLGRCHEVMGHRGEANAAIARAGAILAQSPIPSDNRLMSLVRER